MAKIEDDEFVNTLTPAKEPPKEASKEAPKEAPAGGEFVNTMSSAALEKKPSADPYAQLVESKMPEARKWAKEEGDIPSAILHGFSQVPVIGEGVTGAMLDVEALFRGKGDTYAERRADIGAEEEAVSRAIQEEYPWANLAGNLLQIRAMPGAGLASVAEKIVKPTSALGRYLARALGYGAEGAGYGAATAIGEKIGEKPVEDQTGVGEAALVGGALGTGLYTAGKGIAKTASAITPDWMKAFGSKDYQMKQFLQKVIADEKAGEEVLGVNGLVKAMQEGQPVSLMDIGGSRTQKWLMQSFRNRGEALDAFSNSLMQRMEGAGERFDKALQDTAGINGPFNLAAVAEDSKKYAQELNDLNYQQRAWNPDNGVGIWNPDWEGHFTDKNARSAVNEVNDVMRQKYGENFVSPIGRVGSQLLEYLKLSQPTLNLLKQGGLQKVDDLFRLRNEQIRGMLQPIETSSLEAGLKANGLPDFFIESMTPQQRMAYAKANNIKPVSQQRPMSPDAQNALNEALAIKREVNPEQFTLVNPNTMNVEWLDRYQRQLEANAKKVMADNPVQNLDLANRLRSFKQDIIGGLKGPEVRNPDNPSEMIRNPRYNPETFNPAFNDAHNDAMSMSKQQGAFTVGTNFLNALTKGQKVTEYVNEVNKMNDAELRYFAQGILGQMREAATSGSRIDYNKMRKILDNKYVNEALEQAVGPQKLERLKSYARTEAIMNESFKKASELEKRAGRGGVFQGLNMRDAVSAAAAYFIMPHAGVTKAIFDRVISPIFGSRYATRLREMLESGDVGKVQKVYEQLMNNQKSRNLFLEAIPRLAAMEAARMMGGPGKAEGGRIERATGGRIPEVDKLFKTAKRELDGTTKPILNLHDDDIVKALRIMQGRV